jgi:thioredoxin 1
MAGHVLEISDSIFEKEVLKSEKTVLVDFWAPWCGPCKAIGPVVEELAAAFGDKIKFA